MVEDGPELLLVGDREEVPQQRQCLQVERDIIPGQWDSKAGGS